MRCECVFVCAHAYPMRVPGIHSWKLRVHVVELEVITVNKPKCRRFEHFNSKTQLVFFKK